MRLVFITQILDSRDDALGFVHEWVRECAKNVDSLTVIALKTGDYAMPKNVHVVSLGKEHGAGRLRYLAILVRELFFKTRAYDAVFVHMNPEYAVLFGWWWRLMQKPSLLWYTHKQVDLKLKIATFFVNTIATASKESFRYPSKKVRVMGHGINLSQIPYSPHEAHSPLRLVTVGRVTESKQCEVLIDVVALLHKRGIAATLSIVGGGVTDEDKKYATFLKEHVRTHALTNSIHFIGPVPHALVGQHLAEADCFLNASQTGGLDKAVLEAMAAGILVVTSNDGLRTVLKDFPNFMFPDGDSSLCAERIAALVALPETTRTELTTQLRKIVLRDHDLGALMPRLISLLH